MPDNKLTSLAALTAPITTDIVYIVDDPGTTPLSRKCTVENLTKGLDLTNLSPASGAIPVTPAAGSGLNITLSTTGDFKINSTGVVYDTSASSFLLGTDTPVNSNVFGAARFQVSHISSLGTVAFTAHSSTSATHASFIGLIRSRGTLSSPSVCSSGDALSWISFQAFNNDGGANPYRESGSIICTADAAHSVGSLAGRISFNTTPAGSSTTAERMRIDSAGNVGINGTANANAILDVQSTTRAFMPPRMTTAQKNAVSSPTAGMVVYDSSLAKLCVYTTAWETVTSA